MNDIIKCNNLSFFYDEKTQVIDNLNFAVKTGESVAILGQSGCGKSTLLNLLGAMTKPSVGEIFINNTPLSNLNEAQGAKLRADNLGFVYQFHHLLKDFSAIENTIMPLLIKGEKYAIAQQKGNKILNDIGLKHRINHLPSELSGGERQRVAIARALIADPKCLFADEPTGNLDSKNANSTLDLMLELNKIKKSTLILVTHDEKIAKKMQRILYLQDGKFK